MLHINKLLKLLPNLRKFLRSLESNGICSCLSDKLYLKLKYWLLTGQSLNLKNPSGFCEKLQWLKLYDRKSIYTSLVDKLKVREYVSEKIGNEYLIPMYGAWTSPEEIDFSKLPNQFVLKCNHNSGEGMCICKDKSQINILEVKDKLQQALKKGYYDINRQWPYKDVERKIICEKYMVDDNVHKIKDVQINEGLIDYKFYCFHGEPKFLYVSCACIENGIKHDRLSFYNLDWTKAEFYRKDHPQLNGDN